MRPISFTARSAHDEANSSEVEVLLLRFEHEDLDEPQLFSSDPTVRLSTDPLIYGTRSTWMSESGAAEFRFVEISGALPNDVEEGSGAMSITLMDLTRAGTAAVRSITGEAVVHAAVVLASAPDAPEADYRNLRLTAVQGSGDVLQLTISREPIEKEPASEDRFTRDRFPGLFV